MAGKEPQRLNLPLSGARPEVESTRQPEFGPGASLEEKVIATLRTCYDPELPVDIYELGLIYDLKIEPTGEVFIRMTLTTPNCPVAGNILTDVKNKVEAIPEVASTQVELVWDPPWDKSRMSEAAQLQLGLF